jgi:phosphoenolpyruvate carboxykinase (ATP)
MPTRLPDALGLNDDERVHWNLSAPVLVETAIRRGEARLAANGALSATTGKFTGRTPENRFIVRDASTAARVDWGPVNQPIAEEVFQRVFERATRHARDRELYVQDCFVGADPDYRLNVRVISELAWQSLFARQLFIRGDERERHAVPDFTVLAFPSLHAAPQDGTPSGTCILLDFEQRIILIAGTQYAGEIKKSIFSVMNFLLPERGVLPMHCAANVGTGRDTALFFGLSGTGKTTLSSDSKRRLIGDDEHGWSAAGVFNFEGGCYAKCIRLSREGEPQIWQAIQFGTVLENVVLDAVTRRPEYDDDSLTENTRAAYPVEAIPNAVIPGIGGHPKNLLFLTADAFGVLPPVSRLDVNQALYHFLSGYTAKIAGTEADVREPRATFSNCFGAPFLPRPPLVYARMLGERLQRHSARCWLVNTGWTGGPYGRGRRIPLEYTRAIVDAILSGALESVRFVPEPVFGLQIPEGVPNVPAAVLQPMLAWGDEAAYRRKANELAARFVANFDKFPNAEPEVKAAGPQLK